VDPKAIAVATDFSEQAHRARLAGVALAKRLGASILLIHVLEPLSTGAPDTDGETGARRRLQVIADEIRSAGVAVEIELLSGYAEEAVAAAARRGDVRVLVVGTHGRRAPLRWFLGGVAEQTLRANAVPVLVVADGSDAFVRWAEGARPMRIALALESAAAADPLLGIARLFRRAGACELSFVHVAPRALLSGRLARLLGRELRARANELGAALQLVADGESLAAAMAAFLSAHPADLVAVGIHARSGFDSSRTATLARALLHHHVGPVLGVPLVDPESAGTGAPRFDAILVPTDLSPLGNRAIAHAYAIARGSVTLLHVCVTPGGIAVPIDLNQRAELELRLLGHVPANAAARGISTETLVVEGRDAARAIVDTATRLGSDVICMGSHGRSTLGRVVLGSVASEVLHLFPNPVLIIR
jgi:nucleotide-binding universal stress UspA family protein